MRAGFYGRKVKFVLYSYNRACLLGPYIRFSDRLVPYHTCRNDTEEIMLFVAYELIISKLNRLSIFYVPLPVVF
jgi:hypothetical protein